MTDKKYKLLDSSGNMYISDVPGSLGGHKKLKIYVESIYPISHEKNDKVLGWMVGRRDNNRIKKINKELKESAKEHNYVYLDLYSILVDENDNLKLDYTVDGLHISEEGYKVISNEIKKLMK